MKGATDAVGSPSLSQRKTQADDELIREPRVPPTYLRSSRTPSPSRGREKQELMIETEDNNQGYEQYQPPLTTGTPQGRQGYFLDPPLSTSGLVRKFSSIESEQEPIISPNPVRFRNPTRTPMMEREHSKEEGRHKTDPSYPHAPPMSMTLGVSDEAIEDTRYLSPLLQEKFDKYTESARSATKPKVHRKGDTASQKSPVMLQRPGVHSTSHSPGPNDPNSLGPYAMTSPGAVSRQHQSQYFSYPRELKSPGLDTVSSMRPTSMDRVDSSKIDNFLQQAEGHLVFEERLSPRSQALSRQFSRSSEGVIHRDGLGGSPPRNKSSPRDTKPLSPRDPESGKIEDFLAKSDSHIVFGAPSPGRPSTLAARPIGGPSQTRDNTSVPSPYVFKKREHSQTSPTEQKQTTSIADSYRRVAAGLSNAPPFSPNPRVTEGGTNPLRSAMTSPQLRNTDAPGTVTPPQSNYLAPRRPTTLPPLEAHRPPQRPPPTAENRGIPRPSTSNENSDENQTGTNFRSPQGRAHPRPRDPRSHH